MSIAAQDDPFPNLDEAEIDAIARNPLEPRARRAEARQRLLAAARAKAGLADARLAAATPHLLGMTNTLRENGAPFTGARASLDEAARRLVAGRNRYEGVAAALGCPWVLVGALHALSGSRFDQRLRFGGEAVGGGAEDPAFSWEASAVDALRQAGVDRVTAWTVSRQAEVLNRLSGMSNGYGAGFTIGGVLARLSAWGVAR